MSVTYMRSAANNNNNVPITEVQVNDDKGREGGIRGGTMTMVGHE